MLGFLAHPEFIKRDDLADCNVGIHDQIEALRWTKNHVSKFGGDPNKMSSPLPTTDQVQALNEHCIESSTSQSAARALVDHPWRSSSPHSEGKTVISSAVPSHRASIAHRSFNSTKSRSVCAEHPVFWTRLTSSIQPVFDALLKELKCPLDGLDGQLEWLRTVNAIDLVQASDAVYAKLACSDFFFIVFVSFNTSDLRHTEVLWDWKPVIDGELLPDYPTVLLQSGRFVDVPVIVGLVHVLVLPKVGKD